MADKSLHFTASARKPFAFDYDSEVESFYQAWPAQTEKIFFIDASASTNGSLVYSETLQDEDEVSRLLSSNGHLATVISDRHKNGIGGSVKYHQEDYDVVILTLPRNKYNLNLLGHDAAPGMVDAFSFDHELGHILVSPEDRNTPNLNERLADAYAVIRHLQRFGNDGGTIKNLADMRALEVVFQKDGGHFTSPMVDQIIADGKKEDFSKLTPDETVERARQYAYAHMPDPVLIRGLTESIGACSDRLLPEMMRGDFTSLKKLGDIVLSAIVPEEFKWGAAALRTLLDGRAGIDGNRIPAPQGEEWAQLRRRLDAREEQMLGSQQKGLIIAHNMNIG